MTFSSFAVISDVNMTEWSSVSNHKSNNKIVRPHHGRSICILVSSPINHSNYNFREKKNSQSKKKGEICIKRLTKQA